MTTKEPTKEELKQKEEKRLISNSNLKPLNTLSPEEAKEIRRKGAYASAEKKRQKRTLKDSALLILEMSVSKESAKTITDNTEILKELPDNLQMQDLMNLSLAREAIESGNARAYEALRDTSGQKPTDKLEVEADITTEADRALMLALQNRLGIDSL